jgi:hypothetical protein
MTATDSGKSYINYTKEAPKAVCNLQAYINIWVAVLPSYSVVNVDQQRSSTQPHNRNMPKTRWQSTLFLMPVGTSSSGLEAHPRTTLVPASQPCWHPEVSSGALSNQHPAHIQSPGHAPVPGLLRNPNAPYSAACVECTTEGLVATRIRCVVTCNHLHMQAACHKGNMWVQHPVGASTYPHVYHTRSSQPGRTLKAPHTNHIPLVTFPQKWCTWSTTTSDKTSTTLFDSAPLVATLDTVGLPLRPGQACRKWHAHRQVVQSAVFRHASGNLSTTAAQVSSCSHPSPAWARQLLRSKSTAPIPEGASLAQITAN